MTDTQKGTLSVSREDLAILIEAAGKKERISIRRHEVMFKLRAILAQPIVDRPPATGHAIPQWLRDQFSHIEDHAREWRGERTFTEMRTKVQAYFEMQREQSESAPCAKSQGGAQPAEQDEPVACQVRFKKGAPPEIVSWNEQKDGTHCLYLRPAAHAVKLPDYRQGLIAKLNGIE